MFPTKYDKIIIYTLLTFTYINYGIIFTALALFSSFIISRKKTKLLTVFIILLNYIAAISTSAFSFFPIVILFILEYIYESDYEKNLSFFFLLNFSGFLMINSINQYFLILINVYIIISAYKKFDKKIILFLIPFLIFAVFRTETISPIDILYSHFEKSENITEKYQSEDYKMIIENDNTGKDRTENNNNTASDKKTSENYQPENTSIKFQWYISVPMILLVIFFIVSIITGKIMKNTDKKKKTIVQLLLLLLMITLSVVILVRLPRTDPVFGVSGQDVYGNSGISPEENTSEQSSPTGDFQEVEKNTSGIKTDIGKIFLYIVIGISGIFIIKTVKEFYDDRPLKVKKTETFIKEETMEEIINSYEGIELIENAYKFLRVKYYAEYYDLTPKEILSVREYPPEFKKLTDLYVFKNYALRKIKIEKHEIQNILKKCDDYYKNYEETKI